MTTGWNSETWASCLARFQAACSKARSGQTRDERRSTVNEVRAYHHILASMAHRYGWPPGWDAGKLRELIPDTIGL